MPIVGFRHGLSEISSGSFLEPFARYDVSFAGDPSKRNISNLQLAPFFNLGLPDRWFVAFYPSADIRVEFRRSRRWTNRASFPSLRCESGTQSHGSRRPFTRVRCPHNQGLSSLQLQNRGPTQRDILTASPLLAHHDISLRCRIWSLLGHSGLWPAERPVGLWVHGLKSAARSAGSAPYGSAV